MFIKYLAITSLIASLLFYSCTDTGIFSTIASSQKIEKGTLHGNISSFGIFNLRKRKMKRQGSITSCTPAQVSIIGVPPGTVNGVPLKFLFIVRTVGNGQEYSQ